jgi:hypothetical protein
VARLLRLLLLRPLRLLRLHPRESKLLLMES